LSALSASASASASAAGLVQHLKWMMMGAVEERKEMEGRRVGCMARSNNSSDDAELEAECAGEAQ